MSFPVAPGDRIAGKYVIERLLGEGGMGAVYVARQEALGRSVAIKMLHPRTAADDPARARFEREARAAAALRSDHVARVLDVGQLESGAQYLVMDLLDGEDLSAALERRGPLSPGEVIDAVIQACDALGEAHGIGIVHRDLKPANLFLARRANGGTTVKVLDFGVSKATSGISGNALTQTASLIGSPLYMSPEQLREARNVDGRSDIWALGVTMYELVSGVTPFHANTFAELCSVVLNEPPRSLAELRPELPPDLVHVIMRCLEKSPEARFRDVGELVSALAQCRGGLGTSDASSSGSRLAISGPAPLRVTSNGLARTQRETLATPRRKAAMAVGLLAFVVVGGIAVAAGTRFVGRSSGAPSASAVAGDAVGPNASATSNPTSTASPPPTSTSNPTSTASPPPTSTPTPTANATPNAGHGSRPVPHPAPHPSATKPANPADPLSLPLL